MRIIEPSITKLQEAKNIYNHFKVDLEKGYIYFVDENLYNLIADVLKIEKVKEAVPLLTFTQNLKSILKMKESIDENVDV